MQLRDTATGLTASDNSPITYGMAVAGIAKLRDMLGGTSAASVENAITRTPTPYTSSVGSTGPVLFAVNSAGVSFVRSPTQVQITCLHLLFVSALLDDVHAVINGGAGTGHCVLFQHYHPWWFLPQRCYRYVVNNQGTS